MSRLNPLTGILPFRYFALIVALVVALLFAFALGNLVVAGYQLNEQASSLRQDIARLRQQNERLNQQIAYLKTDEAIETYAREQLGWIRPGDTAIVVVPVGDAPVRPQPAPPQPTPAPNWIRWARYLLGQNP